MPTQQGGADNQAYDAPLELQVRTPPSPAPATPAQAPPAAERTQLGNGAAPTSPSAPALEKAEKVSEAAPAGGGGGGDRQQWSNGMEFLMSCIAMSVGLGNVWRFPFTVYENGGGAFLIPYLIVLALIGKPLYYMEMALGQFASLGSVQVWELAPVFKGIGYGQLISSGIVVTYYCSIMAITIFYLAASFSSELPWATCPRSPGVYPYTAWANCFDAQPASGVPGFSPLPPVNFSYPGAYPYGPPYQRAPGPRLGPDRRSSSELYFKYGVLDEVDDGVGISRGIGSPGWALSLCLAATWVSVWAVTCCGVRSSGKAAYFLALFPYVILFMLLVRGVTLPGALDGIIFFVRPDFDRLLDPTVWYAAVTQCFFSLGVGFGSLVMMSSYNPFQHNIHKDAIIVTSMDTMTSMLAGCTIFGILGNLAHESGQSVGTVVKGGSGLAFVSYPEAIAKFDVAPQVFAFLFFLMLLTLGVGSAVALLGNLTTLCGDALFPRAPTWAVSLGACVAGALLGLVYVTPGGQYVLTLVDYYSGTFPIFVLVTAEVVVVSWVYGIDNLCRDLELMLGHSPGLYWRVTWGLITPVTMIVILVYTIATAQRLEHNGLPFPDGAVAAGWIIAAFGLVQIPLWAAVFFIKNRGLSFGEACTAALRPSALWRPGPSADPADVKRWQEWRTQRVGRKACAWTRAKEIAAATFNR
ncbi:sodium-dependent nutrient amino acid transporter 1-like [Thrips palmi]|uniref:Transporter n=1 Tax=Thrips palmi TaxID=161013 RepID=A0A6P8ZSZ5_THRPL|nr:sodium-dependent nutrient amino acid transporter 1-like [Thrips palmi]